jgi:hypothetical protein
MTDEILIKQSHATPTGWEFDVIIGPVRHHITVSQDYWHKVTKEKISPMELVRLALGVAGDQHQDGSLPESFSIDTLSARLVNFEKRIKTLTKVEAANNP